MPRRAKGEGTISQHPVTGKWRGQVTVGKVNGRLIRKQTARYATKKEAADALAELRKQHHQDMDLTVSTKLTVEQFINQWLENAVAPPNCAQSTYNVYKQYMRLYVIPQLGSYQIKKLSALRIQQWLTELRKTPGVRTKKPLSDWTVNHIYTYFNEALSKAVQWGVITRNPCANVEKPPTGRTAVEPLTVEEARKLLTALEEHRLKHLFLLLISLGPRRGEIIALRWSDYNAKTGELKIQRKAIRHQGKNQKIVTESPKTQAGWRTIKLPKALQDILAEQWNQLQVERKHADWKEHGLIFPSQVGTLLEGNRITKVLNAALKRAGLRHVTVHQLRHSAASLLLAQGVTMADVSRILGHSSPAITAQLYAHGYDDKQREQIGRVTNLFAKDTPEQQREAQ